MTGAAGRATSTGRPAGGTSRARQRPRQGRASTAAAEEQTDEQTTTPAGDSGTADRPAPPGPRARVLGSGGSAADHGAAFVLGLVLWIWVGLPFIQGGPTAVRNVLRAKFFNKDEKGNWLP